MTTRRIAGVATLGLLLGTAPLATAAPGGERGRGGGGMDRLSERLQLTPEQRESWQGIQEQHRQEMEPAREEGRALHRRLREALEAESADPVAVGEAMLAVQEHRKKMRAAHEALDDRLAALLSPEQKQKFEELRQGRKAGRAGRRGFGRGGPGGPGRGAPVPEPES